MWLLNTKTLELREFTDPGRIRFAILSHVWEEDDKKYTFQTIKVLHDKCLETQEDPLPLSPNKVRAFCILAAEEGYEWAWLDTCCIDKSSSAELSEAINSMFAWYKASDICYAYLFDVPDDDDPFGSSSSFRRSKWHTRGWTLQELVAPENVVFLSRSWNRIGTKVTFSGLLHELTGAPRWVFSSRASQWMGSLSVAHRMSWAANRVTTREEDRAYSLMGIFGISMPVVYGEGGERAFLRLQREIVNVWPDQSIFAWGPILPDFDLALNRAFDPQPTVQSTCCDHNGRQFRAALFASSPDDFEHSADITPLRPEQYARFFRHAIDFNCTYSAKDVTLRLPVARSPIVSACGWHVHPAALACTTTSDDTVLVLLFLSRMELLDHQDRPVRTEELIFGSIGLSRLSRLQDQQDDHAGSRACGSGYEDWEWVCHRGALLRLPQCDQEKDESANPVEESSVRVLRSLHHRKLRIELPPPAHDADEPLREVRYPGRYAFEIPQWVLQRLSSIHGFVLVPGSRSPNNTAKPQQHRRGFIQRGVVDIDSHPDDHPIFSVKFRNAARNETLVLSFGVGCRCRALSAAMPEDIDWTDWWIKVFLSSGVMHDGKIPMDDSSEALQPWITAAERSQRQCTHTHIFRVSPAESDDSDGYDQLTVFSTKPSDDGADTVRTVRVRCVISSNRWTLSEVTDITIVVDLADTIYSDLCPI